MSSLVRTHTRASIRANVRKATKSSHWPRGSEKRQFRSMLKDGLKSARRTVTRKRLYGHVEAAASV